MFELFGPNLLTKTILISSRLSVFHEVAPPGDK